MIAGNILHGSSCDLWHYLMDNAKPKVAIDIGANIGDYTSILLNHGMERVFAFEPVPQFYQELVKRHGQDKRVTCMNVGLGNMKGIVRDVTVLSACTIARPEQTKTLDVSPSFAGSPLFDMQVTTLDEFALGHDGRIGFIKLDVDGYEFRVMLGGKNLLRSQHPPMICELGNYVNELGDSHKEWIEFVFDLGYYVFPLDGSYVFKNWSQIDPWYPLHTTFDVLFVHRDNTQDIIRRFKSVSAPEGIRINKAPWHTT